jgi:hypothetical protein
VPDGRCCNSGLYTGGEVHSPHCGKDHPVRSDSEVDRLRAALVRAHEQLGKFEYKGPKQVGRAMQTIENALARGDDA